MSSAAMKFGRAIYAALVVIALATASRAQAESKTFGKIANGPDSVTVKANRTVQTTHGTKTWKGELEVIVYRSLDTSNFYCDVHYSSQDTTNLRNALQTLSTQYQAWRGKRLGTQQREIEIRKGNEDAGVHGIVIDLQMDEQGKIALVFTEGLVTLEADATNLAKFREAVNNALAWLAMSPGAPTSKKPAK